MKKNEQSFKELWDTTKHPNTHKMTTRREKKGQKIFEEIMPEIFPSILKNHNLHIQIAQRIPCRINKK